ncbi:MAG TPA: DUF5312 family protein [Spirochaetia bacterium]|nr:DUF5312 family protein [Spirochaetia bacterium]
MMERSRLEELSQELPEKERRALLERIGRRMQSEEAEEAIPVELEPDERQKIIAAEMKQAGPWDRFLLWLQTFFSGKPREQVFLDLKLRHIRSHLRVSHPGLTGFETRDLSVRFARKLYDVFVAAQPLVSVYRALGADRAARAAAYSWLVDQKLENPKRAVEDFVTTEEMELIFSETGQTEEIQKKLTFRLNDHVKSIPDKTLLELEERCRLHLSLERLAAFPFTSFFRYFNWVQGEAVEPRYPPFEAAPIMLTLDLMERLHALIELLHRSAPDYPYAEEPLFYYLSLRAGLQPGAEGNAERLSTELGQLRADVLSFMKVVDSFASAIPLLDLLRYFRRDPWFTLAVTTPRLSLKVLYHNTLKTRLGVELEEQLDAVKERVIDRKIQDLLRGHRLVEFEYYRDYPDLDLRKLGLPRFGCLRSLSLLYNYLRIQFKGATQEAAQLVAVTVLANNRILQSRLSQQISGLEDLEARLVLFDRTLSPDEDDGKQLAKVRAGMAADLTLQKTYRALVAQKDREARDLIEKAREYLTGVRRIFDDVRTSPMENTRSLLKTIHLYRGRNQTLGQVVNGRSEAIGGFQKLLDQLLDIEKGS